MITENNTGLRLQIEVFLRDFKDLLGQHAYYLNTTHIKNKKTIIKLGITKAQIIDILYTLEIQDYSEGPIIDKYHPGVLWVFGKEIDCNEIYLKLKIVTKPSWDEQAFCISFHESEKPMIYPFKINLS